MAESQQTDPMDAKLALNAAIVAQGDGADVRAATTATRSSKQRSVANTSTTEWSSAGTFQEHWPSHLPRPPSRKKLLDSSEHDGENNPGGSSSSSSKNAPRVVVFNANTQEGSSLVRVLSEKGLRVVAVVRVTSNRNTRKLIKLKHVTVKVADLNNLDAVQAAASGCQQAFLVTKYWERFENPIEEAMARVVVQACQQVQVKRLVLATFEDTQDLRNRGRKSQIVPTADGRIFPNFDGMQAIDAQAKAAGIQMTHMFTSYLEQDDSKKSLILLRGENGKIISQPYIQENNKK